MKRKIGIKQIVALLLSVVLLTMNCYVPEAFAANSKTQNKESKEEKQQTEGISENILESSKRDIIIKYKNTSRRSLVVADADAVAKHGDFEQKKYYTKQKLGIYEVSAAEDMKTVLEELNNDPSVEYAQPNYPLTIAAAPTDDRFVEQWGLNNIGQEVDGHVGRNGVDINVITAWEKTKGEKVVIGILDTGIDLKHKELSNNIYTNPNEIKDNGIDDDGNGYVDDINGWDFANDDKSVYDSADLDAHGTYISGIIASESYNGGIAGVAPKATLLPLKFINGKTGYTSDAIEAIEYAKNKGVKIINCSFGGTDNNPALKDAMESSGILFICSAGNRGADTSTKPVYPAAFDIDNVLSVTSIDSKGLIPSFASYGADVDVAAPGVSVLSTTPGGGYDYYSGTSVSAAFVSGIAALHLSNLPDMGILEIKQRILENARKCTALTGKVTSGARVDANGALTGTKQELDPYVGKSNADDIIPVDGSGDADTWYIMNELASNVERFHYGEGGVNPSSGNYSVTCKDMSIPAPGFTVEISRTYNSRNQRQTLLGRGWTFGFEGTVIYKGNSVEVNLPNGSSHVFNLKDDKYVGEGTRATFDKNVNGVDILTTQDQYKYGFDKDTKKMTYMEDKNGNQIKLIYSDNKLIQIIDTVKREYNLTYNEDGLLSSVTDPAGRKVSYTYNKDKLLSVVTDPEGGTLKYEYDASQYLNKQIDQRGYTFQQLKFSHDFGNSENKVVESTDAAGETWSYSYDTVKRSTTITNQKNRKWTYWFDIYMNTIKVQDPEGKFAYTEYDNNDYSDLHTYYGDVTATVDRNGNRTEYEVDQKTGNTTKIIKPDGGFKSFVYDQWNNVIEEANGIEASKDIKNRTFYIYDSEGRKLQQKAQPLDGKANYQAGNTTNYAVTSYEYYTKSDAKGLFGCDVAGLLKSETDPEGNKTLNTYDKYGNIESVQDAAENKTTYTYDIIGQKKSQTTAKGNKTQWEYDKNGLVIKEIQPDGGIKRTVYDEAGHITRIINPNIYNPDDEVAAHHEYKGKVSEQYDYDSKGYLMNYTTFPDINNVKDNYYKTTYTWDIYGNKVTETKPNGAIYSYEYDCMNRLTKTYFQPKEASSKVMLSEVSYGIMNNGNTQTSTTTYANDTDKSTTVSIKDYANREVEVQYPDLSRATVSYDYDGTVKQKVAANGAITYYGYDPLGNLVNEWNPMSVVNGTQMYSWTGYTYDKAGRLIEKKVGKTLVAEKTTTPDVFTTAYLYEKGQLTQQTDSEGRKTAYFYDGEGRIAQTDQYVSASEKQTSKKIYNFRGQVLTEKISVRNGDLNGNQYTDDGITELSTSYTYDKNGNKINELNPAGISTEYTYDALNRLTEEKKTLKQTSGQPVLVKNVYTYTWDGQYASTTDAKGYTTNYIYDEMGNQTKIENIVDKRTLTTYKVYDRQGRNTAIVSANNYKKDTALADMDRTVFTYDAKGRVIKQQEIYMKKVLNSSYAWDDQKVDIKAKEYQYDALDHVTKEIDALGNTTCTSYNEAGLIESITDAETAAQNLPYTVQYTYNGLGQKVSEKYKNSEYTYSYDGMGNLRTTWVNAIKKQSTDYDNLGRAIKITDARGNATLQKWNALGKLSETITPGDATIASNRIIYQYDKVGNLKYTKDNTDMVTTWTYDEINRNLSKIISNVSGTEKIETSTSYDANGNVTSRTDGNKNKEDYTYDVLNRKATFINAKNQKTTYTYDDNGNLLTTTDYLGNVTKNVYDGINRLVETRDANNKIVQQLLYNDANVQISSFDALHNETKYEYDKNLRQIKTIDAELNSSSMTYDTRGNITSKTDGRANRTDYTYDGENRLTSVTDARRNRTVYIYDDNGNLTAQTDGNGNTTTYQYNAANLLISKTEPSDEKKQGKTESYTYKANGLMAVKIDRQGIKTTYSYDTFGRLTSENAGGKEQRYTYDNNGNLLTTIDETGTTTRTYDALNRNDTKIVPGFGKSIYVYDDTNSTKVKPGEHAESTIDPQGNVTLKTYDKVGRLAKVTVGKEVTSYAYYDNGRQWYVTYPNGSTETYTYDKNNRIKGLVNAKSGGAVISSYSYKYDAAGNQTEKTEAKGTTKYTYDELNRLATVSEPDGKVTSYTYDKAGNRKSEQVNKGMASLITLYNYNAQNRLTSTVSSDGTQTVNLYDNNGNLVSKSVSKIKNILAEEMKKEDLPNFDLIIRKGNDIGTGTENLTTYAYDNYNRLIKTKTKDKTIGYSYNSQGYRVEKRINSKTTRYLYEADKVVMEADANNKQTAFQAYGNALLYRSTSADSELGAQSYYYMYNAHGDVTALMNVAGSIAVTYDYDAFGNIISQTGKADNSIGYAGYQYDGESGLYYLNARYYDSVTARFITEDDPSYSKKDDPLSLNLYTYCHNEPIMYTDPSGHNAQTEGSKGKKDKKKNASATPTPSPTPAPIVKNKKGATTNRTSTSKSTNQVDNKTNTTTSEGAGKSGIDFSKLKPENVTREIAEWLIANPVSVFASQHPYITKKLTGVDVPAIFYAGGFVIDGDGIFHARQEWSLQSFKYSGYNDLYDIIFKYATDMNKAKFQFSDDDGNDYMLWAWKGDYLNLGAGAEMGIYKRMVINGTPIKQINGTKTEHWIVDQSLAMPMTLDLKYKGETIISYDPIKDDPKIFDPLRKGTDKWWVTGFNPNYQDKKASELKATFTVTFNTKEMYDNFYNKYGQGEDEDPRWSFDSITNKAKFEFK